MPPSYPQPEHSGGEELRRLIWWRRRVRARRAITAAAAALRVRRDLQRVQRRNLLLCRLAHAHKVALERLHDEDDDEAHEHVELQTRQLGRHEKGRAEHVARKLAQREVARHALVDAVDDYHPLARLRWVQDGHRIELADQKSPRAALDLALPL